MRKTQNKKSIILAISALVICISIVICTVLIKPSDATGSNYGMSDEYVLSSIRLEKAYSEYYRLIETNGKLIVFNPILPTDTEEEIVMKTKYDYYDNISSLKRSFHTYEVLARIFGEQYNRDTVIIEDEQLQIVYYNLIMSVMDRGLTETDLFTRDEWDSMAEYIVRRACLLTTPEAIQAYNAMVPRLYEYISIYRNRYNPEEYPDPNAEFSGTW